MKINEIITETVKQRLDPKCWKGKHKEGTKIKGGVRVNNCVPNESVSEAIGDPANVADQVNSYIRYSSGLYEKSLTNITIKQGLILPIRFTPLPPTGDSFKIIQANISAANARLPKELQLPADQLSAIVGGADQVYSGPSIEEDWTKVNKHDKTDGMSSKAVKAYRRENPGSKLKTAVTTKPSKLKAGSKDAKRRKSFCARMSGNEGPMKKPNGEPTPKALALRRWNCE